MSLTEIARKIFSNDRFATEINGITIDSVDEEKVVCSLRIMPHHRNAKGGVMGGVIFTLSDFAFAIAANSQVLPLVAVGKSELGWVSSASNINFLAQPKGDSMKAVTTCIRQGRRQTLYQISVYDDSNRLIALVTTTGSFIS